ncbi:MAG: hypothetical protein KDJ16_07635 [Hyphomicrobiales bacterium]|nr:hypothetical protein [Hyphomicrobiales bacterium]
MLRLVLKLYRFVLLALVIWLVFFKLNLGAIITTFDRLDLVDLLDPASGRGISNGLLAVVEELKQTIALLDIGAIERAVGGLDLFDVSQIPLFDGIHAKLDRWDLMDRLNGLPQTAFLYFTWTFFWLWYLMRP